MPADVIVPPASAIMFNESNSARFAGTSRGWGQHLGPAVQRGRHAMATVVIREESESAGCQEFAEEARAVPARRRE